MAQGLDGAEYAFLPHEVRCMGFSTDVNQLSNAMANRFRCSGWRASRPLPGEWKVNTANPLEQLAPSPPWAPCWMWSVWPRAPPPGGCRKGPVGSVTGSQPNCIASACHVWEKSRTPWRGGGGPHWRAGRCPDDAGWWRPEKLQETAKDCGFEMCAPLLEGQTHNLQIARYSHLSFTLFPAK